MNPTPVVLYGEHARLEPLDHDHADQLLEAGADDLIWRYMPVPRPRDREAMIAVIDRAWRAAADRSEVPFAIVDAQTDRAIGSTRFLEIRHGDRALEIGWTWLTPTAQRTPINTECKYLLLRHAFQDLGALRIQFKTDARNLQSQQAIERIGGVREGVLRHHSLRWDGVYRDTVYYSILATEWPEAKAKLEARLGR